MARVSAWSRVMSDVKITKMNGDRKTIATAISSEWRATL